MFQSHVGSISTVFDEDKQALRLLGFNPTLVRLALVVMYRYHPHRPCFNPTLVRLARALSTAQHRKQVRFNPTLVRLAPSSFVAI